MYLNKAFSSSLSEESSVIQLVRPVFGIKFLVYKFDVRNAAAGGNLYINDFNKAKILIKLNFIGVVEYLFWEERISLWKKKKQTTGWFWSFYYCHFLSARIRVKIDGISARKLWKSNSQVRNKITEKGTLKSIRCIDINIIKTLTQCHNTKEFSFGRRNF